MARVSTCETTRNTPDRRAVAFPTFAWHKTTLAALQRRAKIDIQPMATTPTTTRDPAVDAHVFWFRFKNEIVAILVLLVLGIFGLAGYRFYTDQRDASAAAALATAKKSQEYQAVIARYSNTPAGASARLLLAQAQRKEGNFAASNTTLQEFIDKHPNHELIGTARMAMAANLEAMGKIDEALAMYQQVAMTDAPAEEQSVIEKIQDVFGKQKPKQKNFNAPLALVSQIHLLKAKNQPEAVRRVCETIIAQYGDSFWSGEAKRELRLMKPSAAQPGGAPPNISLSPYSAGPSSVPPVPQGPVALPGNPPSAPTPGTPPKP
jgi:predicted negative regulator of RcsB-dependent stress response